jgi:hypothetical protein
MPVELNGEVNVDFAPGGFECRIAFDAVRPKEPGQSRPEGSAPDR